MPEARCAWITFLLTSSSYLPGVLVLAHSLRKHKSQYPLIVAVNPALPQATKDALVEFGLEIKEVKPLTPVGEVTTIAERFVDTWTKIRVFDFAEYERVVLIDADMMLLQNMDELMDMDLPQGKIAATHACVCNLDKSSWAPDFWTKENCPYNLLTHPEAIDKPTPAAKHTPEAHTLLNSGLVVLHPSHAITEETERLLGSSDPEEQRKVFNWMFPDQDLLAEVFRGKWIAIPWIYNAIKTERYWHGSFWRDEQVKNLHYICDKPWKRRPEREDANSDSGKRYTVKPGKYDQIYDGELGIPAEEADAVTHGWWWEEYEKMRDGLVQDGYQGLALLDSLVAQ